jgi:dienelactone hydrolase
MDGNAAGGAGQVTSGHEPAGGVPVDTSRHGGGPQPRIRAAAATWPFTPGSGGNGNRTPALAAGVLLHGWRVGDERLGTDHEFVTYPDTAHAFFWPGTPAFSQQSRDDAWSRILTMLEA